MQQEIYCMGEFLPLFRNSLTEYNMLQISCKGDATRLGSFDHLKNLSTQTIARDFEMCTRIKYQDTGGSYVKLHRMSFEYPRRQ